jgi:hypothetical protein
MMRPMPSPVAASGSGDVVDNKQHHIADQTQGLPTIPIRVWIVSAHRQWVVKDKLSSREAQLMIPLVGAVLRLCPNPPHATPYRP